MWRGSFHDDLAAVLRAGIFTPEVTDEIVLRNFDDQQALDAWLRRAWSTWFPAEPYPR